MTRLPDIVSLGTPSRFDLPTRERPLNEPFGSYVLHEPLSVTADDECYVARGPRGLVFLRRIPSARFDETSITEQAIVNCSDGVAAFSDFGSEGDWVYLAHELVVGASVAALARSGERISWLAALAFAFDACGVLAAVSDRYGFLVDYALSPARIMLAGGAVTLCPGVPTTPKPGWHRMACGILQPVLSLAADRAERALLRTLLTDDDPAAIWVVCDALLERHAELDPVLQLAFLALAGQVPFEQAHAALAARVPVDDLRALWHLCGVTNHV